jgi:hypothetical protein
MMHDKVSGRVLADLDARVVLIMLINFKKTTPSTRTNFLLQIVLVAALEFRIET